MSKKRRVQKVERKEIEQLLENRTVNLEGYDTVVVKEEEGKRFYGFKLVNGVERKALYKSQASGWHYLVFTLDLDNGIQILDGISAFKPVKQKT